MKHLILVAGIIGAFLLLGCGSPEPGEQVAEKEALDEEVTAWEEAQEAHVEVVRSISEEVEIVRRKIDAAVDDFKNRTGDSRQAAMQQ